MQLTLMSIPVGGDISEEIHTDIEQFIRIEEGKGEVFIGETQETMKSVKKVGGDDIVIIPKGVWHNIKNIGDKPMKLYSIYAPIEHQREPYTSLWKRDKSTTTKQYSFVLQID